MIRNTHN